MAVDSLTVRKFSNQESITLGQRHYMTSGGEAELYKMGNVVYKIYHNARPIEYLKKLEWLLNHPTKHTSVVSDILLNSNGQVQGYCMPYIKGDTLGQMYPSSWQQRNRWTSTDTLDVVKKMAVVMASIHDSDCLIVDCNDGNWVINNKEPYALDSDSWQIPKHKATAIMPTIQDPTSGKVFSKGSDWFSWAVITFMLWTGIHPYKGMHPGYPKNSLDKRMKDGVSILDSSVQVPPAARPTDMIPPRLLEWYRQVFEHKVRSAPPSQWWDLTLPKVNSSSLKTARAWSAPVGLKIDLHDPRIMEASGLDQKWLILKDNSIVSWDAPYKKLDNLRTDATWHEGRYWSLSEVYAPIPQASLWSSNGRLFVRVEEQQQGLIELMQMNTTWVVKQAWPCLVNACQWFDRLFVQRLMKATFVNSIANNGGIHSIRTPWLDQLQLHSGASLDTDNNWIIASPKGTTDYTLFYFDSAGRVLEQRQVQSASLQCIVLSTGVGLVASPEQWYLAKAKMRKQWDPVIWSEHSLLGCGSTSVYGLIQNQHVLLRMAS